MTNLTPKQINMMKHAWGWDSREPGFRSHYCTALNDPDMLELVSAGMFRGPFNLNQCMDGYGIFHLSGKALEILEAEKQAS